MNLLTYRTLIVLAWPLITYAAWKRCRQHKKAWQAQQSSDSIDAASNKQLLTPEIPYCFRGRFGLNPSPMQSGGIWIHAVSVGETRSVFELLASLKQQYPDMPITLTNSSIQGAIHAYQFCPIPFQHQMLPLDYAGTINRFLSQIQPKLVLMVETEIWPNLYQACHQKNIPIALINARLKNSSFHAYKKWGGKVIKEALNQTTFIGAQSIKDASNFSNLGVQADKIKILGNLKSDINIAEDLASQAEHWLIQHHAQDRPIWVAASTHTDPNKGMAEEQLILLAHQALLKKHPSALLIIVPRHAERFDKVASYIENSGLVWQRKSKQLNTDNTTQATNQLGKKTQVYLADSLGELMLWYAVSDIAFVGGSLVPFGGHNILEPAAVKTPIISGPHFENLSNMFSPFIAANAISLVSSADELSQQLDLFLTDKKKAAQQTETAFHIMQKQTGALTATLKEIADLIKKQF